MEGGKAIEVVYYSLLSLMLMLVFVFVFGCVPKKLIVHICTLPFYICLLPFYIRKMLYKIRVFHLLYYLIPDEFKNYPEEPLEDQYLSDALLCSCCNCSLLLYQLYHCWNRIVVDKFRALLNCLCGRIIGRRRQTRNNNDNLELPISYRLQQELPSQDRRDESDSTLDGEKLHKKSKNENDLMICDKQELRPPEPAAFLTSALHATPISATENVQCSSPSPSPSSSNTAIASFSSKDNNIQDGTAETKP